jgi:hypothetical protein
VKTRMGNFFDAEMITGKLLMNRLMLDYEIECAQLVMNPSSFTTTNAVVDWTSANIATIDAPRDITEAIERMTLIGEQPDTLVISLNLWNLIRRSTKMLTYIFGTLNTNAGGAQLQTGNVAAAFGLSRIMVAAKSYNTAIKGKTPSLSAVWGNDYVALIKTGESDFMTGGLGRTITWAADSPGGLLTSESYRVEERRGDMLRVRSNRVLKTVNSSCAQLINVVA